MSAITFKNVGQGDSIIIEWEDKGENRIGIIDCNLFESKNPVVDYLKEKNIVEIEFIVLSHFHYDHFSGMPELFKFCIDKNIKIKWFFHTLAHSILQIYDKIFTSKKIENAAFDFFHYYDLLDKHVSSDVAVNLHTAQIIFSTNILMSFLGPSEKVGRIIATQINRKRNIKEFTYNDINKYSTIIYLQSNSKSKSILLTSDSPKGCYRYLHEKINNEAVLVQAPHHGSFNNIYPDFWKEIYRKEKCPVVFSVGYAPKDKLPNLETVEFFDKIGYDIHSTNSVYGISEYFNNTALPVNHPYNKATQYLNCFSKRRRIILKNTNTITKFDGDQKFIF